MTKLAELKNQIIKLYQKAQTIQELKELKNIYYKDYGKFLSQHLTQIKDVYKKRMEELNVK